MGYLSKQTLLQAYVALSENTDTPTTQGATQKVSAIRHLFALYDFCTANNTNNCDLKVKSNRDEFALNVAKIVRLDDGKYTGNFHTNIKEISDCGVSSNFYSVGAVSKSRANTSLIIQYPSTHSLFDISNEVMSLNNNYLSELTYFLSSGKVRLAFALWLLRKVQLDEDNLVNSIKQNLSRIYSSGLIDVLLPNDDDIIHSLSNEFNCSFETKECTISLADLKPLFVWDDSPASNDTSSQVLENPIAKFITRYDSEELSFEEIAERYKSFRDAQSFETRVAEANIFGILYAPHISKGGYKTKGPNSIAHAVLSDGEGSMGDEIGRGVAIGNILRRHLQKSHSYVSSEHGSEREQIDYARYLRALRTKPFMLLAGISGTGKSRIVRELAFKSCPSHLRDKDGTTPGNFLMIEVKPNWHDSSELLGYYSNIAGKYIFTKFIEFAVKATKHPETPFFVCLDEMNLAPVEQYFAEFLSVLETRKKNGSDIISGILVEAKYMQSLDDWGREEPLTLPSNLFIIGTVNMDDTTHQFSRKVIDRAMTIEMNGGQLSDMFGHNADLDYLSDADIWNLDVFKPSYVSADEVIAVHSDNALTIQTELSASLDSINNVLINTPFKVSYRVLNELCIYAGVLLDDGIEIETAIKEAVDQITLMKILPRIEGDEDAFAIKGSSDNRLDRLMSLFSTESASWKKLKEMNDRLHNGGGFTRFWP